MPGVPFSPCPSQPSPPSPAVEGTPMSQPLLQGDIPAGEQDSPAQPGTWDGGWVLWRFGGLEPPSPPQQPPPAPHCGCSGQKRDPLSYPALSLQVTREVGTPSAHPARRRMRRSRTRHRAATALGRWDGGWGGCMELGQLQMVVRSLGEAVWGFIGL